MEKPELKLRKPAVVYSNETEDKLEKIDVSDILESNRKGQPETREINLDNASRRRKRLDYIVLMILVNACLITIGVLAFPNIFVVTSAFAGVLIFSTAFTWIVWNVMRDY